MANFVGCTGNSSRRIVRWIFKTQIRHQVYGYCAKSSQRDCKVTPNDQRMTLSLTHSTVVVRGLRPYISLMILPETRYWERDMCASPTGFGLHIEMNERSSKRFSRERVLRKLNSFSYYSLSSWPTPAFS